MDPRGSPAQSTPAAIGLDRVRWYVTDLLVVPAGDSCSVVRFSDTTHAKQRCRTLSSLTCDRVKLEDGESGCGLITFGACGESVDLVTDPRPLCSKDG